MKHCAGCKNQPERGIGSSAKEQLATLHQQMTDKKLGAEAAIFEAHSELLDDPELAEAVQTRINAGQNPAKPGKLPSTSVPQRLPRSTTRCWPPAPMICAM